MFLYDVASFQQFLSDNNILATTAGVLIAYSAWDLIQSFVGDLTLPAIYFVFIQRFISNKFVSKVFEPVNKMNIPKFISRLISFIIVLVITFWTIHYIITNFSTNSTAPVAPARISTISDNNSKSESARNK
jgi:large-conductance mechanosensitive channel